MATIFLLRNSHSSSGNFSSPHPDLLPEGEGTRCQTHKVNTEPYFLWS